MGLIACDSIKAENPLHIKVLSLNIYSFEELCYIIYENPILVTEGIVNDDLVDFIENELNRRTLAEHIRKRKSNGVRDEDIVIYIIESGDLYNNSESISFRNALGRLRKMADWELLKQRADYMFYIGKYEIARQYYGSILKMNARMEQRFLGAVYNNLGAAYANLFLYDLAYKALKKAYELTSDEGVLMEIYFLRRIFNGGDANEEGSENIGTDHLFRPEIIAECEKDFVAAVNGVRESRILLDIEKIFETEDSMEKNRRVEEYISSWKKEYRNMK